MKKLSQVAALFLITGMFSAQTNIALQDNGSSSIANDSKIPDAVTNRFNTDYPNSRPNWNITGSHYRADYTMGSMKRSITYAINGRVMSTDEEVHFGSYPPSIDEYYEHKFPNESCTVWLNTDVDGNKLYYILHSSDTFWFDKKGKYKKVTKGRLQEPNQQANIQVANSEAIKNVDQ